MKEKIIVVGAGKLFEENVEYIKSEYEIMAVADNYKHGETVCGYKCIPVENILQYDYDIVAILASRWETALKEQLFGMGILHHKLCNLESLIHERNSREDIDRYKKNKEEYIEMCQNIGMDKFLYAQNDEIPVLSDHRENAGGMDPHYFLIDIVMAKEVIKRRPMKHFDIGSSISSFIAHLVVNDIRTTVIDIRPLSAINPGGEIEAFDFIQADATNLEGIPDSSIESISALHSIEHFGLGRYGDEVDPEACFKAMKAMERVLCKGGYLYFAVPVGKEEKVCFNAHRIFSPLTITDQFKNLTLDKMWLLHDMKLQKYTLDEIKIQKYKECIGGYDCGVFIFKKDV